MEAPRKSTRPPPCRNIRTFWVRVYCAASLTCGGCCDLGECGRGGNSRNRSHTATHSSVQVCHALGVFSTGDALLSTVLELTGHHTTTD